MASKPKDMMKAEPGAIADAVAASAQRIWQAGLGAFAKAQQDGGALFDTLVRDGEQLHKLTQELGKDEVSGMTSKLGRLAGGPWERIEKIFEDRVARSLRSLGVPAREDLDALRREVDALKAAATEPKAAARRAPAKAAAAPKRPPRSNGTRART